MTQSNATVSRPLLPVLLLLFVGSGCAALIYEIVWFQLLQLVIGSSAVSLAALLGTFMGGMCLGSLLLPRVIPRRRHPLRVYAQIEFGIAFVAILVLFLMPYVGGLFAATATHGLFGMLLRGLLCAICLLPPTMLMGATLPAIARWIDDDPRRGLLARLLLRRQHRRRRLRLPAGRLLPAARPRHGHGHLRRGGDQPRHRRGRAGGCRAPRRMRTRTTCRESASVPSRRRGHGPSTWQSRCRA